MKRCVASSTSAVLLVTLITTMMFIGGCGSGPSDIPDSMKPGVRVGEDFLVKEVFAEDKRLYTVTDIRFGELDANSGHEIGIAGRRGAIILRPDGTCVSFVSFGGFRQRRWHRRPTIVDADGDGICEFFTTSVVYGAMLLDHGGQQVWSTRGRMRVAGDCYAYGDMDRDAQTEFLFYDYGTLALLSSNGSVMWSREPPFHAPTLHIVDLDEDGSMEIVGTSFDTITVLNSKGSVLQEKRASLDIDLNESSLVPYPTKDSAKYFLCTGKESHLLVSLDGDTVVQEFKGVPWCDQRIAKPVRLRKDEDPYFAIFGLLPWQGRKLAGFAEVNSVLYVFDSEQKLVYHEVIGDDGWAMATVPSGRPNEEVLLVGGTGKVWRYKTRKGNES